MSTVTLKHVYHTMPERFEPFYDGAATAYDGTIVLDSKNITWLRAAMYRGYQITSEGERLLGPDDLDRYIAESEGEGYESEGSVHGG